MILKCCESCGMSWLKPKSFEIISLRSIEVICFYTTNEPIIFWEFYPWLRNRVPRQQMISRMPEQSQRYSLGGTPSSFLSLNAGLSGGKELKQLDSILLYLILSREFYDDSICSYRFRPVHKSCCTCYVMKTGVQA